MIGIAARCVCGAPTVVSTRPRLADGTPFPTLYYLSHPAATAAVSTLEANGVMPGLAELLDGDVAAGYLAPHTSRTSPTGTVSSSSRSSTGFPPAGCPPE